MNESQYLGGQKVLSVGDEGKLRLATFHNLLNTSGWKIEVYAAATFQASSSPVPIADLTAISLGDVDGTIEADNNGSIFPGEGWYILRSFVEFPGDKGVHGDPVKIYVNKGKGA